MAVICPVLFSTILDMLSISKLGKELYDQQIYTFFGKIRKKIKQNVVIIGK